MALVQCEELTIAYEGQVVVRDLSFQIHPGDYLCIVGENGSGKSTLVKSLLGLKAPLKGRIVLGDGLKQKEIGYLPQQTDVQKDFPASVQEVVLSGRLNSRGMKPFYTSRDREQAKAMMGLLGIEGLRRSCFRDLSGGQKQRCACARALINHPRLLLADEPTGALDSRSSQTLLETFTKMNRALSATIFMVTHDAFSASYCSRILFLKDGRIFHELVRGEQDRRGFLNQILDVLSLTGGEVSDAR